ncbi:hypothetical protein CHUAL_005671 [Chamberlinius hualienensis]
MSKSKWRYLLGGGGGSGSSGENRSRSKSDPSIARYKTRPSPTQPIGQLRGDPFQKGPSTSSNPNGKPPEREERCSCCKKRFNLFESLHRVNPPRYCVYCGQEVCKNCHSNDSCHRCFTKERRDVRSVSKLEDMEREELERIMRDLHCRKTAIEVEDKSQLIMTILKECKMDKSFIKSYEEYLQSKKNPGSEQQSIMELKQKDVKFEKIDDISEANIELNRLSKTRLTISRSLDQMNLNSTGESESSRSISSDTSINSASKQSKSEENVENIDDTIVQLRSVITKEIATLTEDQLKAILNVAIVMNKAK